MHKREPRVHTRLVILARKCAEEQTSAAALSSARFTSLLYVKTVSAAFLERTPFVIDDVGDDEHNGDLDLVHGEDDNQVMDEFSCDYFDIRSTDLLLAQVDALWFRTVGS